MKKSGKTYEIAFKPVDVGTHKVIASVGEQQHPNSPFPIRVYDAAEIIVGEIAKKGKVNESIEFSGMIYFFVIFLKPHSFFHRINSMVPIRIFS